MALHPDKLERVLAETERAIIAHFRALRIEYRIAHDASIERTVRESVGRSSGPADPTGAIVTGPIREGLDGQIEDAPGAHVAVRKELERVPKHLTELENSARALSGRIVSAMDRFDPPEVPVPDYPNSMSAQEHQRLKEIQARRGHGWRP